MGSTALTAAPANWPVISGDGRVVAFATGWVAGQGRQLAWSLLIGSTSARATFESRNYGGALTSGHLVLLTDGGDTAGLNGLDAVTTAQKNDPGDQVMAVGLQTADDDPTALVALTGHGAQCSRASCQGLITAPDATSSEVGRDGAPIYFSPLHWVWNLPSLSIRW